MTLRQRQQRYENPDLRRLAQEIDCTFQIPGVCQGGRGMCCHSNKAIHGKGKSKKADDQEHASGCAACHHWYDFGPASRADKDAAFELARYRTQREYWTRGLLLVGDWNDMAQHWEQPIRLVREAQDETPASHQSQHTAGRIKKLRAFSAKTGHRNGASTRSPSNIFKRQQPT